MPTLKYEGELPQVEVAGYGHFTPGDEKTVDLKTALDFDQEHPRREGWIVTLDADDHRNNRRAETENDDATAGAKEESPRGPRTRRNQNDE